MQIAFFYHTSFVYFQQQGFLLAFIIFIIEILVVQSVDPDQSDQRLCSAASDLELYCLPIIRLRVSRLKSGLTLLPIVSDSSIFEFGHIHCRVSVKNQGPLVQSVVSLTSPLRVILLTVYWIQYTIF